MQTPVSPTPCAANEQKKPYAAPQLTEHGAVQQFTQGSGGSLGDGQNSKRPSKN